MLSKEDKAEVLKKRPYLKDIQNIQNKVIQTVTRAKTTAPKVWSDFSLPELSAMMRSQPEYYNRLLQQERERIRSKYMYRK